MSTVIFTSSSLRHKAFAAIINNNPKLKILKIFHEEGAPLNELIKNKPNNKIELEHLEARTLTENDFFRLFIDTQNAIKSISQDVPKLWFSSKSCFKLMQELNPKQILVYGTSIIKGELVNYFEGKILNLHLGISPYYRGSGTNYFPFVNNEPEYAGSTFMYLDHGIDTGQIIHQARPIINKNDSFHQLSNRFLITSFELFSKIAERNIGIGLEKPIRTNNIKNDKRLIYKKSSFSKENVIKLHENFKHEMLLNYLRNKEERCFKVPILEQSWLINK